MELIINDKKVKINPSSIAGYRWELGGRQVRIRLKNGYEIPVPAEMVRQEGEKITIK